MRHLLALAFLALVALAVGNAHAGLERISPPERAALGATFVVDRLEPPRPMAEATELDQQVFSWIHGEFADADSLEWECGTNRQPGAWYRVCHADDFRPLQISLTRFGISLRGSRVQGTTAEGRQVPLYIGNQRLLVAGFSDEPTITHMVMVTERTNGGLMHSITFRLSNEGMYAFRFDGKVFEILPPRR